MGESPQVHFQLVWRVSRCVRVKGPLAVRSPLVFLFPPMGRSPSFTEQASVGPKLLLPLPERTCFEHAACILPHVVS